jgi:hypothetical protein
MNVVDGDEDRNDEIAELAGSVVKADAAETDAKKKPVLVFTHLERLAVDLMPEAYLDENDREGRNLTATDIWEESMSDSDSSAVKQMMSRMIVNQRTHHAYYEALQIHHVTKFAQGKPSREPHVRLLDQLVEKAHKRLISSILTLDKLKAKPTVSIKAKQAAVVINQGSGSSRRKK